VQLTRKASYGLIAAVELARAPEGTPRSAAWIADRYDLPVAFIEKILHELKRAGWLTSRQGCCGGYALVVPAEQVSVRQILEALGEGLDLVDCLEGGSSCKLTGICPTKGAWRSINDRFRGLLDTISLADLEGGKSLATK
jgi:Rrf2 family transcriptional regulator, iron-sulfur cluster assembly transcription factor